MKEKKGQNAELIELFNKGLEKENLLSPGDRDFVKSIASYVSRGSLPTKAQIKRLLKIINKAEDEGYIMPE